MKPVKTRLLTATVCAITVAGWSNAQAALSITNGDFETGAGVNIADVTGWFDRNPEGFWEGAWQTTAGWITPNGSAVIVFSSYEADDFRVPSPNPNDGSFLYQSIGTADGLSSIQIGFDWGAPDDANAGLEIGITIGIYAYDGQGGFIPADDVDVRGASGVTLLDSVSFTTTTTGIDGQIGTAAAAAGTPSPATSHDNRHRRPDRHRDRHAGPVRCGFAGTLPPFQQL